ncbi:STAS domain-containing protein [Streptomyces sp. SID14478]|uniref:STAS domain-containing protein n=1 Tax=Streptomyces sp. SID14478 TaxID=2706073 RepID=UPI0013D9880A|nr:STAS domain-containing protein [Streptomyces sp. SID14478]
MLSGTQQAWTALYLRDEPHGIRIAPSAPLVEAHDRGERISVTVYGDVDIDVAPALHDALQQALRRSAAGLDLELEPLRFCDAAGLRVLLQVRESALESGKTVYIRSASPLVTRLLEITRTGALFAGTTPHEPASRESEHRPAPLPRRGELA